MLRGQEKSLERHQSRSYSHLVYGLFYLFPWTDDGFFVHAFFGFMLLYTSPAHSLLRL